MDTTSYRQSPASASAASTMADGIIAGPEGAVRISGRADEQSFIVVPPISTTRMFTTNLF
jgi:hypothetical protein